MDKILYASYAAAVVLLIATIVLIFRNRCQDDGLLRVSEPLFTAVMGLLIIAMGFWINSLKLNDAAIAGTDRSSYLFVAGFSLMCQLMGDFTLLFTFVKRVVLFNDCLEECSFLGKRRRILWKDIIKVERPVTRKAFKLTDKDGNVITVGGSDKTLKEFSDIAKEKINASEGKDLLRRVENRLSYRR